jgi:hypothetical protein
LDDFEFFKITQGSPLWFSQKVKLEDNWRTNCQIGGQGGKNGKLEDVLLIGGHLCSMSARAVQSQLFNFDDLISVRLYQQTRKVKD